MFGNLYKVIKTYSVWLLVRVCLNVLTLVDDSPPPKVWEPDNWIVTSDFKRLMFEGSQVVESLTWQTTILTSTTSGDVYRMHLSKPSSDEQIYTEAGSQTGSN